MSTSLPDAPRTPPRAVPPATYLGTLLSLLLAAAGVVGVQHLAVDQGWTSGSSWLLTVVDAVDGLTASTLVVVVAVALVVVGLLLVVLALKPGHRTHRPAATAADLWLTSAAVRDLARQRADRVPGVAGVREVRLGRNRLRIDVAAQRDADDVQRRVGEDLDPVLDRLLGVSTTVRATTEVQA